jgi:hypothetical protein
MDRISKPVRLQLYTGNYEINFTEPGTNHVSVKLNGEDIVGSPFSVVVVPKNDLPLVRWCFNGEILDSKLSRLIEAYYLRDIKVFDITVPYSSIVEPNQLWSFNLSRNVATKKVWFKTDGQLIRGTWFWTGDKEELVAYPSDHCKALEKGFILDPTDSPVDISDPIKKKRRDVRNFEGEYRQFRDKADARKDGRKVFRGYKGKNQNFVPVPLLWQFNRVILRGWLTKDCILSKLDKKLLQKILRYSHQSKWDQYALIVRDKSSLK